jgi:hypothetical protein
MPQLISLLPSLPPAPSILPRHTTSHLFIPPPLRPTHKGRQLRTLGLTNLLHPVRRHLRHRRRWRGRELTRWCAQMAVVGAGVVATRLRQQFASKKYRRRAAGGVDLGKEGFKAGGKGK